MNEITLLRVIVLAPGQPYGTAGDRICTDGDVTPRGRHPGRLRAALHIKPSPISVDLPTPRLIN
jgi:hypothetical protein